VVYAHVCGVYKYVISLNICYIKEGKAYYYYELYGCVIDLQWSILCSQKKTATGHCSESTESVFDNFKVHFNIILPFNLMGDGIAQSVYRRAVSWTSEGLQFKSRQGQDFTSLHVVQTGSGAHPSFYSVGTRGSFPGVKRLVREADHSPPTSVELKKILII
jgi:hypothetical protein